MDRWRQYAALAGLVAVGLLAGAWGFVATGGALPWAKRSAGTIQRGLEAGSGSLVDLGRGIVVAGPIRRGGLLAEFAVLALAMALFGIGLYVYVQRNATAETAGRDATEP
jgi:hypothetical protein